METGTAIVQKRLGTKLTFQFEEDKLTRTFRDSSGEHCFSVYYDALNVKNMSKVTTNNTRRYMRFFAVLMLAVGSPLWFMHLGPAITNYVAMLLAGVIVVAAVFRPLAPFRTTYSIVPVIGQPANLAIRIMHDKNHDVILDEIKTRWVGRLRKLHAAINLGNEPQKEFQKFAWLKDNAVISPVEYEKAVAKLKSLRDSLSRERTAEKGAYLN